MDSSDIEFDSDLAMSIKIKEEPNSARLEMSDSLYASEEELRVTYKEAIAKFVNLSATWYPLTIEKIKVEDSKPGNIRLLSITILSEQDSDSIVFGLEFRVDIDVEHGRGMRIDGETLRILEYGTGEVGY